jgi:hypothetical protein
MTKHSTFAGLALWAVALFGAAAPGRAAGPFSLNFDGPGSTAADFAPGFLTIGYGQFVDVVDAFGDPTGEFRWELDLSSGPVPVIDPSTVSYGTAPSPSKALDARDGSVLLVFDEPFSFSSFSATLDNSTFGSFSDTDIKFYDANDDLIFSAPSNQTVPGFVVNAGPLSDVKTILLPATAFYDNVTVVPEPGSAVCVIGGIAALLGLHRRR